MKPENPYKPIEVCEAHKDFEEILTECIEDVIRKVLDLSDDADKAFKESCEYIHGATLDEELHNRRRHQIGLLLEERIKYIKDHWNNTYYLHSIRNGKGFLIVKI